MKSLFKKTSICSLVPQGNHEVPKVTNEADFLYKKAIGSLLYLSLFTRPDISFFVGYLSRFQANPQQYHWKLVKRVFRYLKGTSQLGLKYTAGSPTLSCYCDADFAGDKKSQKSTTGLVIFAFGNPVVWCSKLQSTLAQSSAEAEFIALTHATNEVLFLAQLLAETVGISSFPVDIYEDNDKTKLSCRYK